MAASIYSDFLTEHFPPHSSALQSSDIALLSTYLAGGNEGGDEAIALLKQLRESAVSPRAKDRGLARLYVDALPILAEEYPDIHGKLIALFEALSLHRDASEHPDGLSWALRSLYDGHIGAINRLLASGSSNLASTLSSPAYEEAARRWRNFHVFQATCDSAMVPNVGHGWAAAAVFWYTLESPASATYSPMTGTAPSSLSAAASAPSVARAALEVSIHAPAAAAWFEHDAARILASCQAGLGVSWVPNDATDGVGLWTVRSGSGADNDTAKWSKPKWDFWKDRWQSLENRTSHGLEGMETAVDAISAAARCAIVAMEKAERKASAKKGGARR